METLQADLLVQVESAADLAQLDAVRVAVLGKKGLITEKMKTFILLKTRLPEQLFRIKCRIHSRQIPHG